MVRLALVTSVTCTPPSVPPVSSQISPCVDVAEGEIARLGLGSRAVDVVQDPLDLWTREVRRERQSHLGAESVLAAVSGQLLHDLVGPRVLPDDRVVHGLARTTIPDQGGLALVGDPDRRDVGDGHLVEPRLHDFLRALPDLERVVLDPTRLREDLLVLFLIDGDNFAAVVEHHEARARGALVDCCCVFRHQYLLSPLFAIRHSIWSRTPIPTNPPHTGSWPEPPPETIAACR